MTKGKDPKGKGFDSGKEWGYATSKDEGKPDSKGFVEKGYADAGKNDRAYKGEMRDKSHQGWKGVVSDSGKGTVENSYNGKGEKGDSDKGFAKGKMDDKGDWMAKGKDSK